MIDTDSKLLIAGGSSGMGLALARLSLDLGAQVVLVGRDEAKLARAGTMLGGRGRLELLTADITCEDAVAKLFETVGDLDHIVCTAADIRGAYELLPALDLQAARQAMESKVFGPMLLAKHGAPRLRPSGSITLTSGIAAYRPMPRGTVVAAINAALEGLVRALAVELAPIRTVDDGDTRQTRQVGQRGVAVDVEGELDLERAGGLRAHSSRPSGSGSMSSSASTKWKSADVGPSPSPVFSAAPARS